MFLMDDILKDKDPVYLSSCNNRKTINGSRMKCLNEEESTTPSTSILDGKTVLMCNTFGFEEERQLIRTHPLYPILKLLFIKCERATVQMDFDDYDTSEITKLLRILQSTGRDFNTESSLVDSLMFAAIVELRIHLKQLEQLRSDVEACTKQLNENLNKSQIKLGRIMRNDEEDEEVPTKRHANGFTIAALLADT